MLLSKKSSIFDSIWTQGNHLLSSTFSVFFLSKTQISSQYELFLCSFTHFRCSGEDSPVYRLAGLVEHSGTMRGGHYVAYVRGGQKGKESVWYNISDAHVRQVSLDKVMHSEAYILFYERILTQD